MAKPILETLNSLFVFDEMAELQASVVEAVDRGYGKGEVTLTLAYTREAEGVVRVQPTIKAKVPEPQRAARIFFTTPEGGLLKDDPRQAKLDIDFGAARTGAVVND